MTPPDTSNIDEILGQLAEELINYDHRMTQAHAPNIRFVHKYTSKASKSIQSLIDKKVREARIETAKYFKKYMISTSPFIEEIVDPYIENQESASLKESK